MSASDEIIQKYQDGKEYDHGFVTKVDTIDVPRVYLKRQLSLFQNKKSLIGCWSGD